MRKKNIELIMMLLVLLCAYFLSAQSSILTGRDLGERKKVVIDVGHGGSDPGKVGIGGVLEKDLNLEIAKKVQENLSGQGVEVVMTRDDDQGLYQEGTSNKKVQDMQNRCKLIEEENPDCTVSIHQNSYTDAAVCGPQVFYFTHSKEAATLAVILQNRLNEDLAIENPRVQKENSTYYILKRSASVTVIVECGFITNPLEVKLLADEQYQSKLAKSVSAGVLEYLSGSRES